MRSLGRCTAVLGGLLLVIAMTAPLSSRAEAAHQTDGARPRVVASFSIIGDLVARIGGDDVLLTTLVGAGSDAHAFEPTSADARALVHASIIFEIGLGFESWLDPLMSASGSRARRIRLGEGLPIRHGAGMCCPGHGHDHDHAPPGDASAGLPTGSGAGVDPHVWHNVGHVRTMAAQVRDALIEALPSRARDIRARAARFDGELAALDAWIRATIADLPAHRRRLVTAHESLGYFAEAYGFEVVGMVIPSVSTTSVDPSPAELGALARRIRALDVPVIFADASHDPRLARAVAREARVRIVETLYTDGLGRTEATSTYLGLMRSNTQAIVSALMPAADSTARRP